MNKLTTKRPSRIPRLLRSERYGEVKYVERHTVLGGKTKQEWSLDIAIQGLANICKAKRASHAPKRFAQGLGGRMNSQLEVMTITLQEWICQSTASAAGITHKSAGQAAAVVSEEEANKDDEGPVELTGAYKGLEIDIKRLKERLRYFSKSWEIRIIAICEEHCSPMEMSKDDRAGESVTAYIESIKGVQVFAQETQELTQQDACDILETGEVEVISEIQAPTNIKSLEDRECISNQDSSAGTGVKCSAMYLVTHLTLIQELNKVVKKCKVTAREL